MSGVTAATPRFYNPGWLSDDDLIAGFIARRDLFEFLRGELLRAPARGNVQHYLLVGVRGSGKTSLLNRLAVAIRRETELSDHLIGLSFPEELYGVKNLADFWWAACRALDDALDRVGEHAAADRLARQIDAYEYSGAQGHSHDDAGLKLLLDTCAALGRRPVLLVDNLDFVLNRIDKTGRKVKDPHAHAYWALREALSTIDAPVVIAGSVRLSEPFVDYDKAFYDFFVSKRLGKLSLEEVRDVFDHLAGDQDGGELRQRIRERPGRAQALYELTGGNPRALGLIFELLRDGPSSRAVDDFERLLDITTPYYKARFEELAEQAQVVMHALALSRRDLSKPGFGHTAAVVARRAALETRIVSAQLEVLLKEGVVEKDKSGSSRTQYRIAEQLFRLWLQMRSTRRIRQQVIGLTEFLEALFDREEYEELMKAELTGEQQASWRSRAKMIWALSELQRDKDERYISRTHAADALRHAGEMGQGPFEDAFARGDLPAEVKFLGECREKLERCASWHQELHVDSENLRVGLLGSVKLSISKKRAHTTRLCARETAAKELESLSQILSQEWQELSVERFSSDEIIWLYEERAAGRFPLPKLTLTHVKSSHGSPSKSVAWKLLCGGRIDVPSAEHASGWVAWGKQHFAAASSTEWAEAAGQMLVGGYLGAAQEALDQAFLNGDSALAWAGRAMLFHAQGAAPEVKESAFEEAISRNRMSVALWHGLIAVLLYELERYGDAEAACRKAIELDPKDAWPWSALGRALQEDAARHAEAEYAYRKAIDLDPKQPSHWTALGNFLSGFVRRQTEAEMAYREAIKVAPRSALAWYSLGRVLATDFGRYDEAEKAIRYSLEIDPKNCFAWTGLGALLGSNSARLTEAESVYRKAVELEPDGAMVWGRLSLFLFAKLRRYDEAESAIRKSVELEPDNPWVLMVLGMVAEKVGKYDEAKATYLRVLELSPKDRNAMRRLDALRHRDCMKDLIAAGNAIDWAMVRKYLSQLLADAQLHFLVTADVFVRDFVGRALRDGHGLEMLAALREVGFDSIAAPLLFALDAAIEGGKEKLADVEPEARAAALFLFDQLQSAGNS
jgi:tetratricopeptide (TPR) repeat protein